MAKKQSLPAGITQRADGRYMWRFKYNGHQYTGYAKKLVDAKKELRDKRYEVEHGLYSKQLNILMDAWFTEWLRTYKEPVCKETTLNDYRNSYNSLIKPIFGRRKLKDIRTDQVQRALNKWAADYSGTWVNTAYIVLCGLFKQAVKSGIIVKSPMEGATLPKCKARTDRSAITAEQERVLLAKIEKTSKYYPIYRAASLSGMRLGELLALSWDDVDFELEEIRVTKTVSYVARRGRFLSPPKSKSSVRMIPMHKGGELYNLMRRVHLEWLNNKLKAGKYWRPEPTFENLVFLRSDGTLPHETTVERAMDAVNRQLQREGIEIPRRTFHVFRHCFATRSIEAGMDPKTLQAILGHSSFAMTMDLYCDVMEDTKRREMRRISAAL